MSEIASFVFFDIETTGLPHLERNKTKITELCFVAALRNDLENAPLGARPYYRKLSQLFNPQKNIQAKAAEITGLTNDFLKKEPIFKSKTTTLLRFLEELPKPVCLVAHNGDVFDYKVLLAEFADASVKLPMDLLCVDSLKAFKSIIKNDRQNHNNSRVVVNDSLTDEDWSELDISAEDWDIIDSLSLSFTEMSTELSTPKINKNSDSGNKKKITENKNITASTPIKKIQTTNIVYDNSKIIENYTLSHLYKVFLNKEIVNAHRAEGDCMMLLECVTALKGFLKWADNNCKIINVIEPIDRNKYDKSLKATQTMLIPK